MSEVRIAAEPRTEFGKGAARRIRRDAKVPVVLYGGGQQPQHYSVSGHELMLALKHDPNVLLALQTEQGERLALAKSVMRDPIKGFLEHVDLVAVERDSTVTVEVPVQLTGEAGADTLVAQQQNTVTVEAGATDIPDHVEVDVSALEPGSQVTAGDVELPEGVTLAENAADVVVQAVAAPSAAEVDAELAASEAELGAGQAGGGLVQESGALASGDVEAGEGTGDIVPETAGPDSTAPDATTVAP